MFGRCYRARRVSRRPRFVQVATRDAVKTRYGEQRTAGLETGPTRGLSTAPSIRLHARASHRQLLSLADADAGAQSSVSGVYQAPRLPSAARPIRSRQRPRIPSSCAAQNSLRVRAPGPEARAISDGLASDCLCRRRNKHPVVCGAGARGIYLSVSCCTPLCGVAISHPAQLTNALALHVRMLSVRTRSVCSLDAWPGKCCTPTHLEPKRRGYVRQLDPASFANILNPRGGTPSNHLVNSTPGSGQTEGRSTSARLTVCSLSLYTEQSTIRHEGLNLSWCMY
jgi:hypothetical protein